MTSRAAVLLGKERLEIREFPLPETGPDDGLLRIEATGVCGSDVHAYRVGSSPVIELPCVLGHELVGRVERVGEQAAARWGVAEGDRVVVEEYLPCGVCRSCLAGAYQMCEVPRYGGKSIDVAPSLWGGYSDYMYLHPRSLVHRAGEDVPAELLQLYVPISNGLHWVQGVGGATPGSTVVVVGPGPHGLGCVVGAREVGAGLVVLVGRDRDEQRLALGRELGADHVLSSESEDVPRALAELTGGRMADTVVNAADSGEALVAAAALAGDRATIVQVGLAKSGGEAAPIAQALVERLLTIRGVLGRPSSLVPHALRLIESRKYPLERLCSGTFEVGETEAALNAIRDDPGTIRSVVVPAA